MLTLAAFVSCFRDVVFCSTVFTTALPELRLRSGPVTYVNSNHVQMAIHQQWNRHRPLMYGLAFWYHGWERQLPSWLSAA